MVDWIIRLSKNISEGAAKSAKYTISPNGSTVYSNDKEAAREKAQKLAQKVTSRK